MTSSGGAGGLGGSTSVNVAALEAKAAAADAADVGALQENSEISLMTRVDPDMANPAAAARTTKKELKFKSLEARKKSTETEGKPKSKSTEEKMHEDLADKHSSDNPEISAQDLRSLKDSISPDDSPEDILKQVAEKFPDPVLASQALDYLDASVAATDGALKSAIIQAKATHNATHKQAIVGGKNISFVTQQFASSLKIAPGNLRQLYLDVTSSRNTCKQLFDMLNAKYVFNEIAPIVSFIGKGISADLKSSGSSIEPVKLMLLLEEIKNLSAVMTTYSYFETAMPGMQQSAQAEGLEFPQTVDFIKLTESFQNLVSDNYPQAGKCERAVKELVGPDIDLQSIVLNQFYKAARSASPRLYQSSGKREALLTSLANALDNINKDNDDYPKTSDFPKPSPWS